VEQTREWLRRARRVAVLTGAGVSAESGVPTFRGKDGLWKHYRPEDLATPDAFLRDPRLVWQWYNWRRGLVAHAQPNRGHYALADLERLAIEFTLITQNVDDLHEQAGSTNVVKLHGDIWLVRCLSCAREWIDTRPAIAELPPRCCCGGLLRTILVLTQGRRYICRRMRPCRTLFSWQSIGRRFSLSRRRAVSMRSFRAANVSAYRVELLPRGCRYGIPGAGPGVGRDVCHVGRRPALQRFGLEIPPVPRG